MSRKKLEGNNVTKMLNSPDKGIGRTNGVGGVLAGLARKMMNDLGITPQKWFKLMHDYVTNAGNNALQNRRDQTNVRGNLTKEFSRPQMTWKVFCKFMVFLKIRSIKLSIQAFHEDGRTTIHSTQVDFKSKQNEALEPVTCLDNEEDE